MFAASRRRLPAATLALLLAALCLPGTAWTSLGEATPEANTCCPLTTLVADGNAQDADCGPDCGGCLRPCCKQTQAWPSPVAPALLARPAPRPGWPGDVPLPPAVEPRGIFRPPCR